MEKPLMRSLKDSRSGISQTTGCSFVHVFFHVVSNSLRIPWVSMEQELDQPHSGRWMPQCSVISPWFHPSKFLLLMRMKPSSTAKRSRRMGGPYKFPLWRLGVVDLGHL
jgi:hypothetical protein